MKYNEKRKQDVLIKCEKILNTSINLTIFFILCEEMIADSNNYHSVSHREAVRDSFVTNFIFIKFSR